MDHSLFGFYLFLTSLFAGTIFLNQATVLLTNMLSSFTYSNRKIVLKQRIYHTKGLKFSLNFLKQEKKYFPHYTVL